MVMKSILLFWKQKTVSKTGCQTGLHGFSEEKNKKEKKYVMLVFIHLNKSICLNKKKLFNSRY
jgi:hypothetical protein